MYEVFLFSESVTLLESLSFALTWHSKHLKHTMHYQVVGEDHVNKQLFIFSKRLYISRNSIIQHNGNQKKKTTVSKK